MNLGVPSKFTTESLLDPAVLGRINRGRRYRSVGWLSVLGTGFVYLGAQAASLDGPQTAFLVGLAAAFSLFLINWTRLWVRESREPFQYSFSVGAFDAGPAAPEQEKALDSTLGWLQRDLTEKLGERVPRLSLVEEEDVPAAEEDGEPAPHVHVSGWYGLRQAEPKLWMLEIVPKVRIGGKGCPAKLASTVRYFLRAGGTGGDDGPPTLEEDDYKRLFERVYWSVASQIYAQIREGVERKVKLLPPGRLRAAAYLSEADDYATSNTLDAYEAARRLYRIAQEIYDVGSRRRSATTWRRGTSWVFVRVQRLRCSVRRGLARVIRRLGRREILTARAQLGFAWMLVAEWHLKLMSGRVPNGTYEALPNIAAAIRRLEKLPRDVEEQKSVLFRAWVTMATAKFYLGDYHGAKQALWKAECLRPASAREDPEFLLAAGMLEMDPIRSLRLLGKALELAPNMERAHFHRAQALEDLWRGRDRLEAAVARAVVAEYAKVSTVNPGNLGAWANRGFICWLLSSPEQAESETSDGGEPAWKELATSSLEAGRQYKEVRGEASVAELDWNLTRIAAEQGDFITAYGHYTQAVSAMLAEPRLKFLDYFYKQATPALVRRFVDCKDQVLAKAATAEESSEAESRLIRSVVAFTLNDCGLAHRSLYHRSKDERQREKARSCFEQAAVKNPAFVLPQYNLADMDLDSFRGEETTRPGSLLEDISDRLDEVIWREPDWALARLLQAETQVEAFQWAVRKRSSLQGEVPPRTSARCVPPLVISGNRADPRQTDTPMAQAKLDRMVARAREGIQASLSALLPHSGLRLKGEEEPIAVFETEIKPLIRSQRDRWTRDYTEIHVAALAAWAKVVTSWSAPQAMTFCAELRGAFSDSPLQILSTEMNALRAVQAKSTNPGWKVKKLLKASADCEAHIEEVFRAAQRWDPVHLQFLEGGPLPADEQRAALTKAVECAATPSALAWLAARRSKLGDLAGALETARAATGYERHLAGGTEWLQLGDLFETLGDAESALFCFRRASSSATPGITPIAAMKAISLLEQAGRATEVPAEMKRAEAKPDLSLELATLKEAAGDDLSEAIEIVRGVTDRKRIRGEVRARAQIELAEKLLRLPTPSSKEAEDLLRQAVEAGGDSGHRAATKLGLLVAGSDPTEAESLYRLALEQQEPNSTLAAAKGLVALLQSQGRGSECAKICAEAGKANPWIAVCLGDHLAAAGDEQLAAETYAAGIDLKGPPRPFAADARLRLADISRKREAPEADSMYRFAIASGDLRVSPDAAVALFESVEDNASHEQVMEACRDVVAIAIGAGEGEPGFSVGFCRELGQRLVQMEKTQRARALYSAFLDLAPAQAPILAEALRAAGDAESARRLEHGKRR